MLNSSSHPGSHATPSRAISRDNSHHSAAVVHRSRGSPRDCGPLLHRVSPRDPALESNAVPVGFGSMDLDGSPDGPKLGHSDGSSVHSHTFTSNSMEARGTQPSSSTDPLSGPVSGISESTASDLNVGGGTTEAIPHPVSSPALVTTKSTDPNNDAVHSSTPPKQKLLISEEELLNKFQATLEDNDLPPPCVNFDEEKLLSDLCKRRTKGKSPVRDDDLLSSLLKKSAKQKGHKIHKKSSKKAVRFDDDVGDGLLSALLCSDVTPAEIDSRFRPR